ncbi:protein CCSMST1-like [Patiria miniata]|uniref:Uncharacterized protein n=1 Tax=Patiria miniata TaxID=46514 RepID=A0A914AJ43_PATMI|nr:protein CCSMST1-like [Patiria miniata]
MTFVNCSRVLKVMNLARSWPSRSGMTAVQRRPILPPSCQHRCASSQQTRSKTSSKRTDDQDEDNEDEPLPYLNSKARDWSVHNSYGRHKKRPWYKVAPLSIGLAVFMAWVFLRKETEIDRQLEVQLHERLPNLFEDPSKKNVGKDPILVPESEEEEKLKE